MCHVCQEPVCLWGSNYGFLCYLHVCYVFFRCPARTRLLLPMASWSICFQEGSACNESHCAKTGIYAWFLWSPGRKGSQVTCISILAHLSSGRAEMHLTGISKTPCTRLCLSGAWSQLGRTAWPSIWEVWFWLDSPSLETVLSIFSKGIFSHFKVNL